MKFGHIAFCMLIISLSYILWDYWNIGTLSFILKYDLVYCAFVISVTVIALWKGYKILANCNFQKFIIILICSFMTIIFVLMIFYKILQYCFHHYISSCWLFYLFQQKK